MIIVPAAASPPPLPACTTADDLRAARAFARRWRGWVLEELFAEAGVVILRLTAPQRRGGGSDLAWVIERAPGWLRVYTADRAAFGDFAEMGTALEAIRSAEAAARASAASAPA
jgi:hypothetical protein